VSRVTAELSERLRLWRIAGVLLATTHGLPKDLMVQAARLVITATATVETTPVPRRWHRCRPLCGHDDPSSTDGQVDYCACGAIRFNAGQWIWRNSRR
jgi:hypothetical protein